MAPTVEAPTGMIPGWVELLPWIGLALWIGYMWLTPARVGSATTAMVLCGLSFPAVAAVVLAVDARPDALEAVRLLLWLAVAVGLTGVTMWLQHRDADDEDDGGEQRRKPPDSEPPWWPEFERDFRDYARRPPVRSR